MTNDEVRMKKLTDYFESGDEFERMLERAQNNPQSQRAAEFLSGLRDKYDDWGDVMYLSEAQYSWLQKIADGG